KLSTMVWTVVAAQKLGQFGFGVFNLALALGLILIAVGGWGFTSVFVRRASRDTSRVSQYFTEIVVWQGGLTAPLVLLGVVVYSVVTPETTAVVPMAMVLLAGLFDPKSDTARAASSTVHRQGTTSLALIAQRLITSAVAIPAVMIWGSALALSVAFLFSSLLGVVLHGFALGRLGIRFRPRLLTMDGLRHSLRGTHWIGLGGVARAVQYRAG